MTHLGPFLRAAVALALGLLLAVCDSYEGGTPTNPSLYSMDGRWVTTGGAPVDLTLELDERRGEITGVGTIVQRGPTSSTRADTVPVAATGSNEGGALTIRIVSTSGLDAVFRGRFSDEKRVSGHLGELDLGFVRQD